MNTEERELEMQKEIKRLRSVAREMNEQLNNGHNYLMSVRPENFKVENALEAFGFGRNGLGTDCH